MKITKITKSDFQKYRHQLVLTICYTIALIIVYSTWALNAWNKLWISVLIAVAFIIGGTLVYCFWISALKSSEEKKEAKQ